MEAYAEEANPNTSNSDDESVDPVTSHNDDQNHFYSLIKELPDKVMAANKKGETYQATPEELGIVKYVKVGMKAHLEAQKSKAIFQPKVLIGRAEQVFNDWKSQLEF